MIADGTLTLVAAYDFHRNGLNKDDAKRAVEEVLAQVLGGPYSFVCITQDEVKAVPAPAPRPARDDVPAAPLSPVVAVKSSPPPAPDMPSDEPPWDFDAPAPDYDPEPPRAAPSPAPRPQARLDNGASAGDGPPRALVATADERYITAVRNIFNAVEIQTDGALPVARRGATEGQRQGDELANPRDIGIRVYLCGGEYLTPRPPLHSLRCGSGAREGVTL